MHIVSHNGLPTCHDLHRHKRESPDTEVSKTKIRSAYFSSECLLVHEIMPEIGLLIEELFFIFFHFKSLIQEMKGSFWKFWFYILLEYTDRIFWFFITMESCREKTGRISFELYDISLWVEYIGIDWIRKPLDVRTDSSKGLKHIGRRAVVKVELLDLLSHSPADQLIDDPSENLEKKIFFILKIASIVHSEVKSMRFCYRNLGIRRTK